MFTNHDDIKTYMLAGHAKLTLTSERTGARYTYKIDRAKDRDSGEPKNVWFVSLLTGQDNTSDYNYMGMLNADGSFRTTAKSRLPADSKPVLGFAYLVNNLMADRMPPQMEVRHEGTCGRCGRALTVPESVDRGIGPECFGKMGM
jgi:hypothetical protein